MKLYLESGMINFEFFLKLLIYLVANGVAWITSWSHQMS